MAPAGSRIGISPGRSPAPMQLWMRSPRLCLDGGHSSNWWRIAAECGCLTYSLPAVPPEAIIMTAVSGGNNIIKERRPPRALQWRASVLARLTGWRWRIESGVQTQSGDQGNGFTEGLAAVEQIQHGIAVVAHQHQGSVGQPAAHNGVRPMARGPATSGRYRWP